MNREELDRLYSPSIWSPRHDVINIHLEFARKETTKNLNAIPCELDTSYGNKPRQKYDVYGIDLPDDAPIFIYIHGGYWQELEKETSGYVVEPFYKNKIKTFVVGYTLCPEGTIGEIIKEIQSAVKKIIQYAIEKSSRGIYISGYSAGSHLIACLFTDFYEKLPVEEKSLIKAVVLCCGVYNLIPLVDTYVNESLKLTYETAKELSPVYHDYKKFNFKIFIAVAEWDSPRFEEQSHNYFNKIRLRCDEAKFKIIKNVDHFSIVEKYACEAYELVQYILNLNNTELM